MSTEQKPILYSMDFSPPARTVWLTAKYIGLDLDVRNVNFFCREQLTDTFLQMNPQHTIPTLDDNGFHLWESAAICTYLIDTYGPANCPLYPAADRRLRARIDQRLYFNAAILFPEIRLTTIELMVRRRTHLEPAHLQRVRDAYAHLEAFLANGALFMVGDQLTLADLALITNVGAADVWAPLDPHAHARIVAWQHRVAAELPFFEELIGAASRRYADQIDEWLVSNRTAASAASEGTVKG